MNSLFIMAVSNVIVAGLLAVAVYAISRVYRKPAVIHGLWILVLLKLITPPLFTIPVSLPASLADSAVAVAEDQTPAETDADSATVATASTSGDLVAANDDRRTPLPFQPMRMQPAPAVSPFGGMAMEPKQDDPYAEGFLLDPGPPVMVKPANEEKPMEKTVKRNGNRQRQVERPVVRNEPPAVDLSKIAESSAPLTATSIPAAVAEQPSSPVSRFSIPTILGAIWIVGSVVLALWTFLRVMYFRHLLQQTESATPELQNEVDELAATMGLSKSPEVRLLPGAVTPMLWAGCGRPQLLFPRELLGRTDQRCRAMLLMHELAHMRRGDHWVRFLELAANCLYWWNPIVWLAMREIHRTEEECCDALVVEHSADCGLGYANALLDTLDFLAESGRGATRGLCPSIVSGIGRVDFIKQRLTMILSGSIGGRMSKLGRGLVLVAALVILPLLPVLGNDADETTKGAQPPAASGLAAAKNKAKTKKPTPPTKPVTPNVGRLEPTDFETRSRTLQFDPLEVRSVDISRDGKFFATGHGRWSTAGMVRVWDYKTKKELHAFPERLGIATVVFSPDSKLLATAGWAETLIIRNTKDFKILHEIPIGKVARLAFSPDGKMLATATEDNRLQLWNPKTGRELPRLKGTFFRMQTVAFSPDGRYIAVGGGKFDNPQNGRVSAWDLKSGKQIKVIDDLRRPVISVAFAKDGKTLAAGGFDNQIHLYNSADLSQQRTLTGHTAYVEYVTFTPDGKTIASASNDRTVRLWDVATGDQLTALNGHTSTVMCAAFTKDGKTLISGGLDKLVRVWDTTTYRETETLQPGADGVEFPEPVLAVAYSPNGRWIASAHEDKTVRLRDATTGTVIRTLAGHDDVVSQLAFSPDGKTLATASYDKLVKLWNVADGKPVRTLAGHTNWVFAIAFSPDGKRLASAGYDKSIRLWNVADGKSLAQLKGHFATVRTVAFSPDGKRLVSGSGDRTLKVWNLKTRKVVHTMKGHQGTVRAVAFSPDGETIASGGEDNLVKLWNANGNLRTTLKGHSGMVWCLAFSPRGQTLATAGFDNNIMIWDPESGRRRKTLSGHTDVITSLAFEPTMKGLVSGSYDKTVRFWTAKQPPVDAVLTIAASPQDLRSIAFSPNGRFIATGGHDRLVKVWESKTGRLIHVLRGHTGGVRSVAFSRDGNRLASGGWDHRVIVWNMSTGKPIASMQDEEKKHNVTKVAFTPDGRRVASGGYDKTVRLWDIDSRKMLWKSTAGEIEVAGIDISPDGKLIASVTGFYKKKNDNGQITFFETETGKTRAQIPGPPDAKMIQFSPDGRRVMVGSGNSRTPIRLIDVKTRQSTNGPRGFRAAFLPDGKTIVVAKGPNRQVYLYNLETKREVARFVGHPDTPGRKGSIYDVAASADGSVVASISIGGTVKFWPLRAVPKLQSDMSIQATIKDATRFALPTKDGRHLITGGHDKTVKIWDRKTGKLLHTLKGQQGGITSGAISPDGKRLVVGSWDSTARVWNLETRKTDGPLLKHKAEVVEVAWSKDGSRIITSGRDKMIHVWDAKTRKRLHSTAPQNKAIVTFDISPDEKLIAGVVSDWKTPREPAVVKFWSLPDLKDLGEVFRHRFEMKVARFSSDGKKLAVAGTDMLSVLDVKSRKMLANMPTVTGIMDATFADNDRLLISGDWRGRVIHWNAATGQRLAMGSDHNRFIFRIAYDAKASTVISAGMDGTVKTWPLAASTETLLDRIRTWKTARPKMQVSIRSRVQTDRNSDKLYFAAHGANDQLFAVGGQNGEVRVFRNQAILYTLTGNGGPVWTGAFSPDDSLLATAGDDRLVRLWEMKTGKLKVVLKGHKAKVESLLFTGDGAKIISADAEGEIRLWETATGREVASMRKVKAGISTIALSPDGKLLAAAGWSKTIDLWQVSERKHLATLVGHDRRILSLAFSPDGQTLVSGDAGRDITDVVKIWDVKKRKLRTSLNVKMSHIHAIAFSPDGRTFATSGADKRLRLWDLASGQLVADIATGGRLDVRSIHWSVDGRRLITASIGGTVRIWNVSGNGPLWMPAFTTLESPRSGVKLERVIATHEGGAWAATWSPDGKLLATGGIDKIAVVWNTSTWKEAYQLKHYPGRVYSIRFSPDGKTVAVGGSSGPINLYEAASGKLLREMKGHEAGVRQVAFSPDGKRLVSVSWDKTARIWDVAAGKLLHTCRHKLAAYCVAISPDNKSFAVGSGAYQEKIDGFVTFWDLRTGKKLSELKKAAGIIHGLSFYDDDQLLVTRAANTGLSLWDPRTSKQVRVMHQPVNTRFVRVSRDRKRIILTHQDKNAGKVSLWNLGEAKRIGPFKVSRMIVITAEESPDHKRFVTASRDGSVKLWRLETGDTNVALKKAK